MKEVNYSVEIKLINNHLVLYSNQLDKYEVVGIFNCYAAPLLKEINLIKATPQKLWDSYIKVLFALAESYKKAKEMIDKNSGVKRDNKTISLSEASKLLNVSCSTTRRLIDCKKIDYKKTPGGHRRPYFWSVYKFIESLKL